MSPRCENYHLLYPSFLRKRLPYSLLVLAVAAVVLVVRVGGIEKWGGVLVSCKVFVYMSITCHKSAEVYHLDEYCISISNLPLSIQFNQIEKNLHTGSTKYKNSCKVFFVHIICHKKFNLPQIITHTNNYLPAVLP